METADNQTVGPVEAQLLDSQIGRVRLWDWGGGVGLVEVLWRIQLQR